MAFRIAYILAISLVSITLGSVNSASISNNLVYETPRINNGNELVSSIVNECFSGETMLCLKGKVLTYFDTMLNLNEEQGRSFESKNIDKVIYNRVAKILSTNEFKVKLPETLFQNAVVSYRSDRGIDVNFPNDETNTGAEARGHLLKKKLLLPVLLLLKLKMKLLMPIFVALIGLKAMKALILSKLAITVVLGFVIYQLVQKTGLGMPMAMTPMMPPAEPPMTAYGPPPSSTSSYDPSSWEPSSGGPYARIWEPSSGSSSSSSSSGGSSSHKLAYSSYYPSSSSSSSSSGSAISSGSTYSS